MNAAPAIARRRIAVIGSGAVGCYYGGRLAHAGGDVHFLMRSDLEHVRRHGLEVRSAEGDFRLDHVNAYSSTDEIGPCDLVIIALKATANAALQQLVPPLLKDDTMLLTLQNGLGSDEFLAERWGAERVLGGLCFVCINRVAPGVIEHYGHGTVSIGEFSGPPQPRTHDIRSDFERSGIVARVVDDLAAERWKKLVWNVPFNGISIAAGGIDVAEILASEPLAALTRLLMDEVIAAARALGHNLPDTLADDMITKTKSMGPYRPSSLIDFLAGREVEIDAIWGEPSRRAAKAGAQVGALAALRRLIEHAASAHIPKQEGSEDNKMS